LALSHFVEQAFEVLFADMAKEKVVERPYVCVRSIADYIDCGIRMKEVFDGGEKFLAFLFVGRETLDLHEFLKLQLDLEVLDWILFVYSTSFH